MSRFGDGDGDGDDGALAGSGAARAAQTALKNPRTIAKSVRWPGGYRRKLHAGVK